MPNDLQRLEQLVARAVDRLRRVSAERDALQVEVEALRERLAIVDEAPAGAAANPAPWLAERLRIVNELTRAVAELRGE